MIKKEKCVTVQIVADAFLPRFTLRGGDMLDVRPSKITKDGFPVGNGFLPSSSYKKVKK